MHCSEQRGTLVVELDEVFDTSNAHEVERVLMRALDDTDVMCVRFDAKRLDYISSVGLRVVMKVLKRCKEVSLVNASPEVYEVFTMTGISELMDVRRRPREIRLDGLTQIGAGAFGRVYRIDAERVVKVYRPHTSPLERVERERRAAREAFVNGIPSAIPFEVVRAGDEYGVIYELVDAQTLGEAVCAEPERLDEYARATAELATTLHTTSFERGKLPDARLILHGWVDIADKSRLYAPQTIRKLRTFVDALPDADTFVHGDFHPANIMVLPDGELLLIDMGDASMGTPYIDLAGMYHVVRVAARRPGGAERLCGMPLPMLDRLWSIFLRAYYRLPDDADVAGIEQRLAFCALPRTMGSTARSKLIDDETRVRQAAELERVFLSNYDCMHNAFA